MDEENAEKVIAAVNDFGFASLGIMVSDLLDKENVIQLGYPPARIDLLTDIPAVNFEECYTKREVVDVEGVSVNLIDVESLIKTKLATGRPQDKVDAEKLKKQK